jgi:hypothetical protein
MPDDSLTGKDAEGGSSEAGTVEAGGGVSAPPPVTYEGATIHDFTMRSRPIHDFSL